MEPRELPHIHETMNHLFNQNLTLPVFCLSTCKQCVISFVFRLHEFLSSERKYLIKSKSISNWKCHVDVALHICLICCPLFWKSFGQLYYFNGALLSLVQFSRRSSLTQTCCVCGQRDSTLPV